MRLPDLPRHVKWFTDFSFADEPRTFTEIMTPTTLVLATATAIALVGLVLIDDRLDQTSRYRRFSEWLSSYQQNGPTIVRLATSAVLIVSWENRVLLAPELGETQAWYGWFQLVVAIALLVPRASRVAGAGVALLWLIAVVIHGAFHMLDYLHYVGIGIYVATAGDERPERQGIGIPALYLTVGFSLIWAGFEKLTYPGWSLVVLDDNPQLAFGLPPEFFVSGAAFVEIALGFLLIIGLLERPLAALVTVVFIGSTLVFGRVEIVGHTPIHAALAVFVMAGPGSVYRAPINFHERLAWRGAFTAVNFVLAIVVFAAAYTAAARAQFHEHEDLAIGTPFDAPAALRSPDH
ncbi:MAG: DoxX family membrane protein [Actinomycetota bacterium]